MNFKEYKQTPSAKTILSYKSYWLYLKEFFPEFLESIKMIFKFSLLFILAVCYPLWFIVVRIGLYNEYKKLK